MTRRQFLPGLVTAAYTAGNSHPPLIVPVHQVIDGRARLRPEKLRYFWSTLWPEAFRNFAAGGIRLQNAFSDGEVRRSPGDRPIFTGLHPGVINMVITNQIPLLWDSGRGLNGVTTRYEGYHICMIAMDYAHGNQIPLLSVNTCVHELLHALLQDVYEDRPGGFHGQSREFRVDWFATRLWLFHDGSALRDSARSYLRKLRSEAGLRS